MPTLAEAFTTLGAGIEPFDELNDFANADSPNLLGLEDTFVQSLEGNYVDRTGVRNVLDLVAAALTPESVRGVVDKSLLEIGAIIDSPNVETGNVQAVFRDIHDYMVANSETIQEREYTLDTTPNADGGNTFTGSILRLTVDENGTVIQDIHTETKTARCIEDQSTNAQKHEEEWEFYGETAERNYLLVDGSGNRHRRRIRAPSARDSLVINASFSQFGGAVGTGNLESLVGWTAETDISANAEISTSVYYRDFPGDSTPASLFITADEKISQTLADVRNISLDPSTPYWLQVAVRPTTGTSGGNIIIEMGGVSRTVALTGLSANAWNIVGILSAPGANCWFANFNEADLDISIEIENLAGGTGVYVDDVLFVPFSRFDAHWYLVVPSAATHTPPKRLDKFTWSDSLSAHGKIQYWAGFRAGYGYLPSTTGTPTYADPS